MDTFSAHPAVGFGPRPEILKGLFFHQFEQRRIGKIAGPVLGFSCNGVEETGEHKNEWQAPEDYGRK
jgi:hypothetical protein